MEVLIGQVLYEKYHIKELLGQGGMGTVYLATHLGTDRPVALKVIRPQYMADAEFIERFKREAKAAGRLRHPNVINVTDCGFAQKEAERVAYLVMEDLDGCSLAEVLREEIKLPLIWVEAGLAPVIAIEDISGDSVLLRSKQLASCLPRVIKGITLPDSLTTITVFLIPLAISHLFHLSSIAVSMNCKGIFQIYVDTAGEIIAAIAPIVIISTSIFLTPLFALIYGVLYFALRQANGERFLGEFTQKFEDEITDSKWQIRLRTIVNKCASVTEDEHSRQAVQRITII